MFSTPSPLDQMKLDEPSIILGERFSMEPAYYGRVHKMQTQRKVDRNRNKNITRFNDVILNFNLLNVQIETILFPRSEEKHKETKSQEKRK